jgi:hypothetical protein
MDKPPDPDELLKMSENLLDREELEFLNSANISSLDVGSGNLTISKVASFDKQLRHDYYLLKKGSDEKPQFLQSDFLNENNPLKAEMVILKLLWNFMESLKMPVDGVTVDALILHRLQSQILWRISSFDENTGREVFVSSTAFDSKKEVA